MGEMQMAMSYCPEKKTTFYKSIENARYISECADGCRKHLQCKWFNWLDVQTYKMNVVIDKENPIPEVIFFFSL